MEPLSLVAEIVDALRLGQLARSTAVAAGILFAFFLLISALERHAGADRSHYRTRNFVNDIVYALFYQGGFYAMFIGTAVANLLEPRLSVFQIGLVADLPVPLAAVVFWVTADFLGYWVHRLQHAVPFLWAFHSVHHANERLTYATSWRIHPVEQLLASAIMLVPLLVLGMPTEMWIPLWIAQYALEAAQHSALPWRYGPLYGVLVSPVFHAVHHSTAREDFDHNYGKILSLWDVVFGTAAVRHVRPARFGLEGTPVPESLSGQMVAPFRQLYDRARTRRVRPQPVAPSTVEPP